MKRYSVKSDKKTNDLNNSVYDAMGYSAMVGFGETYLLVYAIFRGATEAFIGFISSFPFFIGSILQVFAPYVMKRLRMRKELLLVSVFLTAVSWLLVLATVFISSEAALPLLLVFFTVYVAAGMFGGSIWSSWIADLVPEHTRGWFFGRRNALAQIAAVFSTLVAGLILNLFQDGTTFIGFFVLFMLSFLCRIASWRFLDRIRDPPYYYNKTKCENPVAFLTDRGNSEIKRSILAFAFFYFAVFIISPFFVLYMMRDLQFTYVEYMLVILSPAVVRVFAMPYWGKISERFGNKAVLLSCAFFISFIPVYWFFLESPLSLMFFEMFSGLAWAGIDLCLFNHLLGVSRREDVSSNISNHNFFMNIGRLVGPNVGAALLLFFGTVSFFKADAMHMLMLMSVVIRLAAFVFLAISFRGQPLLNGRKSIALDLILVYPTRDFLHGVSNAMDSGKHVALSTTGMAISTGKSIAAYSKRKAIDTGGKIVRYSAGRAMDTEKRILEGSRRLLRRGK